MSSANLKRARDLALELPENERAALAHDLLSSLDDPADADADADADAQQAWEAEITKRLDELIAGNAPGLDVDEALGKIDARIRRR